MKDKSEEIDVLLERNAEEQLSGINWDVLRASISNRLDEAQTSRTLALGFPKVFKMAAGITAAALMLIAVMVATHGPPDTPWVRKGSSTVKFTYSKAAASVEIIHARGKPLAVVDVVSGDTKVGTCDVEIIDSNGGREKDDIEPAWVIIRMPEPALADNGDSRYDIDLICLF